MKPNKKNSINNILEENRIFAPSKEFSKNALIKNLKELIELKEAEKLYKLYQMETENLLSQI